MGFRSDLDALILGALDQGSAHGYEIAKRIKARSGKLLQIAEGQLYPALHRLEERELVVAEWEAQQGKPSRKLYALTPAGKAELAQQKQRWKEFVQGVSGVLQVSPTPEGNRG